MESEQRDVVIVGAGIAGLAAAWDLRNRDVVVLEATSRVGGRIRSEARDRYWLNLGAHVFSGPDTATGRLIADVGVDARPVPGRLTALSLNGKLLTRGRVETYPLRLPLSVRDRAAVIRAGAKLRLAVAQYARIAEPRPGETPAETRARIIAWKGDESFADWFGALPPDADALFRPTVTRSTAEPEQISAGAGIGYFHLVWSAGAGLSRNIIGGSQTLLDGIARELDDRVRLGRRVSAITQSDQAVTIRYDDADGAQEITARYVIVAVPAHQAGGILPDIPAETRDALGSIPYGPMVVMAVLTGETGPMPYDDLYAVAAPKHPFSLAFNMANVVRSADTPRQPGGSLMLYAVADKGRRMMERSDAEVEQIFLDALADLFPQTRGVIRETLLLRLEHCIPFTAPGRSRIQPAIERPLGRIHLAGDHMGTWYTESAVSSAQAAAKTIRQALQREPSIRFAAD
jgi:protoporphyrinogen/coproporphyrinogen III oxidase